MHRVTLLLLGFLALAPAGSLTVAVQAQTLEHMAAGVHQDLSEALAELSALREQIDAERLPMARQLTALEDEVLSRRRDYDRAQRQADNRLVALGELRREVEKARVDARFLSALLTEYVTRFETRIHVCEVPRYKTEIATAKTGATQTDLAPAERLQKQLTLLDVASARLDGLIGGDRFAGRALTPAGRLESGQFALVGPLAFFASAESPNAGVAELRLGSAQPRSLELGARPGIAIRALAGTGSGVVPIDATLGNALKIAEKRDSLVAHVMKGGPVMIPILLLGLVAVAICIAKWFQLARIRVVTPMELQTVLSHLRQSRRNTSRKCSTRSCWTRSRSWRPAADHRADGRLRAIAGPAGDGHRHDQHLQHDHDLRRGRSADPLGRHLRGADHDGIWIDRGDPGAADPRVPFAQSQGGLGEHGTDHGGFHQRGAHPGTGRS
jgi:biopolymer transport protein ExbB